MKLLPATELSMRQTWSNSGRRLAIHAGLAIHRITAIVLALVCAGVFSGQGMADDAWRTRLDRAGDNRAQLELAWSTIDAAQRPGLEFLLTHMPERDLRQLSAEFLLENCQLAYQAWQQAPWRDRIGEELFFNEILPYASVNEVRDAWRRKFFEELRPVVAACQSPGEAAAKLNQQIFSKYQVKYSTERRKAIQSPLESMESGLASCSGLSIMLVDACRAVGVPARFVGVPRWTDNSGNHSWVEVWDGEWKFTGAAEPNGGQLNAAWFTGRAVQQKRDESMYAIYAASFLNTPQKFPIFFGRRNESDIFAVNVTDRYTALATPLTETQQWLRVRSIDEISGKRLVTQIAVVDPAGTIIGQGQTNDDRFDRNDHWSMAVNRNATYEVRVTREGSTQTRSVQAGEQAELVTIRWASKAVASPLDELKKFLKLPTDKRPVLAQQAFAAEPLDNAAVEEAKRIMWMDHVEQVRANRAAEMEAKTIEWQEFKMPFAYSIHGEAPATGRSLYISMHGGGEAPPRVNDRQWENQKKLYTPDEGVYLAPRAPTNSWNMWHQAHIDPLYDRLITNLIVFENVDPNRVYLLGYSAGGDGVYQVAPRMADRFAAAAMMAGHPNEAQPWGLRNLPLTIHMGANDSAFQRNEVAASWGKRLEELRQQDLEGYESFTKLHEGKGHWMDRQDAEALSWLAARRRNPWPRRIVWFQDDVIHQRFYWLQLPAGQARAGLKIEAECSGQKIEISTSEPCLVGVRMDRQLLDLAQPVEIWVNGQRVFQGLLEQTIGTIAQSLAERGDPSSIASAEWTMKSDSER